MVLLLSLFEPVLGNGNLGVDEHALAVKDSTAEILSGELRVHAKKAPRLHFTGVAHPKKFVDGASIPFLALRKRVFDRKTVNAK